VRPDVPAHDFNGGNRWVQDMIANLYGGEVNPTYLHESKERARYMLENACLLEVTPESCNLRVRITNQTGHKLPTGYPEGRRMWINVEFRGADLNLITERGAYRDATADLTTSDTKVYEAKLGLDEAMAAATGLPAAPSFHFVLNNKYYKDNRIPPRGFTFEAFAAVGAAPVAADYADGQFWDDTLFRVPPGAASANVKVYYQTASKEYITFLRDENTTNEAGELLYAQWSITGMSPPTTMRETYLGNLTPGTFGDADCDHDIDLADYSMLAGCVTGYGTRLSLGCEALDADINDEIDLRDIAAFQRSFGEE
jgi:hypothetical protein